MGLEGLGGVGEAVALFVGGLRFEAEAEAGVGALGLLGVGDGAVLWCRRRWRDGDDVHDVMVRGARKSRTGAWLRANVLGERSLAGMLGSCCCSVQWQSENSKGES